MFYLKYQEKIRLKKFCLKIRRHYGLFIAIIFTLSALRPFCSRNEVMSNEIIRVCISSNKIGEIEKTVHRATNEDMRVLSSTCTSR